MNHIAATMLFCATIHKSAISKEFLQLLSAIDLLLGTSVNAKIPFTQPCGSRKPAYSTRNRPLVEHTACWAVPCLGVSEGNYLDQKGGNNIATLLKQYIHIYLYDIGGGGGGGRGGGGRGGGAAGRGGALSMDYGYRTI